MVPGNMPFCNAHTNLIAFLEKKRPLVSTDVCTVGKGLHAGLMGDGFKGTRCLRKAALSYQQIQRYRAGNLPGGIYYEVAPTGLESILINWGPP